MVNAKMISKVTAEQLKNDAAWLMKQDCGCCSHIVYHDKKNDLNYYICMGWSKMDAPTKRWTSESDSEFCIATKIGRQSTDNIMQTDLDIDFEMPYDKDTNFVDDTEESLDDPKCYYPEDEDKYWEWLAETLNEEAVRVVQSWC